MLVISVSSKQQRNKQEPAPSVVTSGGHNSRRGYANERQVFASHSPKSLFVNSTSRTVTLSCSRNGDDNARSGNSSLRPVRTVGRFALSATLHTSYQTVIIVCNAPTKAFQ